MVLSSNAKYQIITFLRVRDFALISNSTIMILGSVVLDIPCEQ